ncbi:GntR family transcriptional regulator [Sphingobacterium chuzhouense]|uniref:GntR family transcriptional regulator n=1 Tax=Sphingobacterium chuzhouense TaxID=1742264 RepID=A0ABR7XXC2_9SPHI|nr:GntR family transcriptional regulator [Sphingobacterium chuzhouense]MBD1423707.1 GntR family transcriptional regulator [Sphingobacterium chuzhouense]
MKSNSLDKKELDPLHIQAETYIRQLIEKEEYKAGKLLPTEVELAKMLNISRNTLRQAINKLVYEGLLLRKRGHGTRVVRKGIVGGIKNWLSFSQEMKMLGIEVKNFELHIRYTDAPTEISNFFMLEEKENTKCLLMERVRGNTSYPFVYFISYFNPDIPLSSDENFRRPLYEILEKDFGVIVKTSKEEVYARLAGDLVAQKLEIKATDPILVRKRFVYDDKGRPIEYNIGYYRADSFTYTIEAER